MNLGIIRCDSYSDNCPAASCLKAVREKSATFSEYSQPVLVGIDTCGGCDRGKADRITAKAQKLKDLGAEAIHFGNCLVNPCPYLDTYGKAVEDLGLRLVKGTH